MLQRSLSVTTTELHLDQPVAALDGPARRAVLGWLREHGIPAATLAPGTTVKRDPHARSLAWRERQPDGSVRRRWRFVPGGDGTWPRDFPAELFDDRSDDQSDDHDGGALSSSAASARRRPHLAPPAVEPERTEARRRASCA